MNKYLERANDRHIWNPGVVSYAMIPRCRPNSIVLFLIVTSIVYGLRRSFMRKLLRGKLQIYLLL